MLVKPNEPVINFRTSITGLDCFALHLSNATPLSDIQVGLSSRLFSAFCFGLSSSSKCIFFFFTQEKLLELFPTETIMVGHLLNKDLKALKMDHARVIDTSLLFKYDFSAAGGIVGKLPRPSLDHLCKVCHTALKSTL